jgi:hypothetical protein
MRDQNRDIEVMKNTKLFYRFSGPLTNNVIHSQVIENMVALQKQDIDLDLQAWCGWGHFRKNKAAYNKLGQYFNSRLSNRFKFNLTIDRLNSIDRFRKRNELWRCLQKTPAKQKLLQTRSADFADIMTDLSINDPSIRFVYELRGDSIAEAEYLQQLRGMRNPQMIENQRQAIGRRLESADLITCVSTKLADKTADDYRINRNKFFVMPCVADRERFKPDPDKRLKRRNELGVNDKHLIVYSGSLSKNWDVPERISNFIRNSVKQNAELRFLLLSPDIEKATNLASEFAPGIIQFRSLSHWEVQDWLCCADSALLIRDLHPLNQVASPTKAAEYLLCGLSLIISPEVGDYTSWVENESLGVILQGEMLSAEQFGELENTDSKKIRSFAKSKLDRNKYAVELIDKFGEL